MNLFSLIGISLLLVSTIVIYIQTKKSVANSDIIKVLPSVTNGKDLEEGKLYTKELIGYAKEYIHIFTGSINADIHSFESLKRAHDRGIDIKIITSEDDSKKLERNSDYNRIINQYVFLEDEIIFDRKHFIVVDGKYFRIEEKHNKQEKMNSIINALYVYDDSKISLKLERSFQKMFAQASQRYA